MNENLGKGLYTDPDIWNAAVEECWKRSESEAMAAHPALHYTEIVPDLPGVLIIGDSISVGYTAPLRAILQGKANVVRIPENGEDTLKGLKKLDWWLNDYKWDVIHFNWGLHDLRIDKQISGSPIESLKLYGRNLEVLTEKLLKQDAQLIWAQTTPVPVGAQGRVAGSELAYNDIAFKLMERSGIRINDLHARVCRSDFQEGIPHNVHFTEEGSCKLAFQTYEIITETLTLKPGK